MIAFNLVISLEHDGGMLLLREFVDRGETGWPGADDDAFLSATCLVAFPCHNISLFWAPPEALMSILEQFAMTRSTG